MSPRSKKEYLEAVFLRYKNSTKKEKTAILNEYCNNCECHRKHAIRSLRKVKIFTKPKPKKRGEKSIYKNDAVLKPLKNIWLASNLPCSKRLKVVLPLWLKFYDKKLSKNAINSLVKISASSIDRLLKPTRIEYKGRGRSTTKPGTLLRKHIPIKTNQWDEKRPGFLEADTVAHCGESLAGMFAYTIDFVDIATGWTEQRAVWGKGEAGVLEQIKNVENNLPFPLLGFDCDNGSEFLNHHLVRHFSNRKRPVQFTRSRPYHKDDNAHIEQKNWTHVRQWFGYDKLGKQEVVPLMNDLYSSEWKLYHNFFCPSFKLIKKERIGSKIIKQHDEPKTPFQRIIESNHVSQNVKNELTKLFKNLNPFQLRKCIEIKLKKIFKICYKYR